MRFTVLRSKVVSRYIVTNKISLHEETLMTTTRKWEIQNSMFRTPVYCFSGLFKRSKHGSSY